MKTWLLPATACVMTLLGGAAMAQPYGGYQDARAAYAWDHSAYRGGYYADSDGDHIPDRVEWGRDRDHDGRPDQWDRYDSRRDGRWEHRARWEHRPSWGYGYRY
jgi:hypothetical protein